MLATATDRTAPLLATERLTIVRGGRRLVVDANVAVRPGEAIHLCGDNGSGKSTSLRVFAGLTRPAEGRVAREGPCAFVPEKVVLTGAIRCGEWLEAMRRLRGAPAVDWERALMASGLEAEVVDRPCGALSKGMLQRVTLIEAFATGAPLVLMDEPFSGLDPDGRRWLGDRIEAHRAGGGACVFTGHSDSSSGELRASSAWLLQDGTLSPCAVENLPARDLRVISAVRAGDHATHQVPAAEVDAVLVALIDDGWHVDAVTRP
jgi:ABC-type multidrug transport system ATPase subunit